MLTIIMLIVGTALATYLTWDAVANPVVWPGIVAVVMVLVVASTWGSSAEHFGLTGPEQEAVYQDEGAAMSITIATGSARADRQ